MGSAARVQLSTSLAWTSPVLAPSVLEKPVLSSRLDDGIRYKCQDVKEPSNHYAQRFRFSRVLTAIEKQENDDKLNFADCRHKIGNPRLSPKGLDVLVGKPRCSNRRLKAMSAMFLSLDSLDPKTRWRLTRHRRKESSPPASTKYPGTQVAQSGSQPENP